MPSSRRDFLTGLISLVAAPAIVRAGSLMPIRGELLVKSSNTLLTLNMITREAVRLFANSNKFLQSLDEYDDLFKREQYVIGSQLRIRLPSHG